MKLLNFDLERSYAAISLRGLGYDWDLHNYADFQGIRLRANDNSLELTWIAPCNESNAWGSLKNEAMGCKIVFYNLCFLHITQRDKQIPLSEDLRISSISKVDPNLAEYRCKERWDEIDEFNLLFEFGSERTIEIGAESAELIAMMP